MEMEVKLREVEEGGRVFVSREDKHVVEIFSQFQLPMTRGYYKHLFLKSSLVLLNTIPVHQEGGTNGREPHLEVRA